MGPRALAASVFGPEDASVGSEPSGVCKGVVDAVFFRQLWWWFSSLDIRRSHAEASCSEVSDNTESAETGTHSGAETLQNVLVKHQYPRPLIVNDGVGCCIGHLDDFFWRQSV